MESARISNNSGRYGSAEGDAQASQMESATEHADFNAAVFSMNYPLDLKVKSLLIPEWKPLQETILAFI
jgi:hypothetical protein